MVSMQESSGTKWLPSPRGARLAAGLGPGNGRVVFDQPADGGGGQQEILDMRRGGTGHMIEVITQGGRQHPRRAVGRVGDHLAAAGVLFVHRQGIDADPVVDRVWRGQVQAGFGQQGMVNGFGPTFDRQAAGQHAIGPHATFDTGVHYLP